LFGFTGVESQVSFKQLSEAIAALCRLARRFDHISFRPIMRSRNSDNEREHILHQCAGSSRISSARARSIILRKWPALCVSVASVGNEPLPVYIRKSNSGTFNVSGVSLYTAVRCLNLECSNRCMDLITKLLSRKEGMAMLKIQRNQGSA
jgi:hypothetical protein